MLRPTERPLSECYDLAALDLDGTVYVGREAVPGTVEALEAARSAGMRLAFVTNNAARTPQAVADQLVGLGIEVSPRDVVTSAQASARLLASRLEPGAVVYLIGGEGLEVALRERGLEVATEPDADGIAAVVQGYGPAMPWKRVVDGAILVASGLPWVASNTDLTIPTDAGLGPGNGTLVELVARFADREPEVAGKPEAPLFEETRERVGGERPLAVGDRLDTDIEGAVRLGWDCLLVMTGVTDLAALVAAPPQQRPTFIGANLRSLGEAQPEVEEVDGQVRVGGWSASIDDGALRLDGDGSRDDWWRCAAVAGWRHHDAAGRVVEVSGTVAPE